MKIFFHKDFQKQFKKSSLGIKEKIKMRMNVFKEDQYDISLNNHALQGKFTGYRSINVTGDIRIIFKVLGEESVLFVKVGSHSKLYS